MAFVKDDLARDDLGVGMFRVPAQKSYKEGYKEGYKNGVDSGTKITIDGEQVTTLAIDDFVENSIVAKTSVLFATKADVTEVEYLAKKIANIQSGLAEDMFIVDDSVATTKIVPKDSAQYALIDEIGGKATRSANLFNINSVAADLGIEVENGTLTIEGEVWTNKPAHELFPNFQVGEWYTLSYEVEYEPIDPTYVLGPAMGIYFGGEYISYPGGSVSYTFCATEHHVISGLNLVACVWEEKEGESPAMVPCKGVLATLC